ncbi:hypothetical protein NZD89_10845 [Alicyclobacillus fastidiosus]|uniref:Protein kinase A anchor protein nuclear localisation signal domain-containing protein n=1 Tax=Alicyclobacillus fastidiosus TaxID=392011 RepID=A0ABY6ZMN6_9BACL|nr:hypothetical protein [Alicyclobacillus fastidiosus]WAH43833.1 hypothetical protein NZD89_10845 [Alicyclobacillus fastidiosus]GMA60065.1 hypothetical protein GCM10025859_05050 [Alicyclobacillus fastidiosus]
MEPEQYSYKSTELHTTVLAIITCTVECNPGQTDLAPYIEVLTQSVASIPSFNIRYRGITASPECVMIQGFPLDLTLQKLRQNIRDNFRKSGVKSTLDERFKTHTAHMTCLRFQNPVLNHPGEFLQFLKRNRDFDFGTSEMTDLDFVVNDWYMSDDNVEVLHRFPLHCDTK